MRGNLVGAILRAGKWQIHLADGDSMSARSGTESAVCATNDYRRAARDWALPDGGFPRGCDTAGKRPRWPKSSRDGSRLRCARRHEPATVRRRDESGVIADGSTSHGGARAAWALRLGVIAVGLLGLAPVASAAIKTDRPQLAAVSGQLAPGDHAVADARVALPSYCALELSLGHLSVRSHSAKAHQRHIQFVWTVPTSVTPGPWHASIACAPTNRNPARSHYR